MRTWGANLAIGLGVFLLAGQVAAAELTLAPAEVENLGIELTQPRAAERIAGVAGRGRVVVPPDRDQFVSAAQPGLLVRLYLAGGDPVSEGQLLAEVRSPSFIAAQRAFLDALTADGLARARLARDLSLVSEGIASRRRLEGTEAEAKAAAAALSEQRQMLDMVGMTPAEIDGLAATRDLRALLPVRSPIAGVVLEMLGQAGTGVTEADPLYRVADVSTLWLEIEVPEDRADSVEPGMAVALSDRADVGARVLAVGRSVDPRTQTVTIRAAVVSGHAGLRPGQFVAARIIDDPALTTRSWSVPAGSVVRSGDGHFVFVRTTSGFRVKPVNYLGADGDRVFIAGDLEEETRLAASGVSALKALWGGYAGGDG